jgi:alkanesulfonate monooxygenase SsuD/methylene tetrahydromethanopterin reductase-like flavin-dependent oxidoreductase (luciferase family)
VAGEFELLGADFEQRGATLDASLDVIREAFITGAYQGAAVEPRASRAGGPPIWVGGSSGPAIRRAARVGDGWLPQGPPKMGMRQAIELIKTTREQRGVDPEDFDIGLTTEPLYVGDASFELGEYTLTGSPEEIAARLRRYRKVGANQMQVRFESRSLAELLDQIERFAAEVWPLVTA